MAFSINELAEEFDRQAEWRRTKAAEFPDDGRNAEAAALFDRLAASASGVTPEILTAFLELYEGGAEIWNEWLREVGFHRWPATADELLKEFIADRAGTN